MAKEICRSHSSIEQLATVFDNMFDAVFILDAVTENIVYANRAMCTMYGYLPSEALQLTIPELSSGEPCESFTAAMDSLSLAAQGSAQLFEWKARKKDGSLFWTEISLQKAGVAGKDLVIALMRDITERKRMEEELLLSHFCIDKAGIGIYQSDETGTIFNVNEHACKSLGYSKDELCAISVFDIDPVITHEIMLELKKTLDASGSVTFETIHLRKDGTGFPVEITANNLDFRGKTYGISFVKDMTERKRAEDALREANLVVEHSPVVLFRWKGDDEWPVELVSGNIIQFGYNPDEFLSGSITYSSIIHPGDLERVTREVHEFCNEGADQFRLEYRIMTKGGDIRWVNEHTNVERDTAGVVESFEGIVIDVTERRRAEDSIRESRAKYQAIVDSFDGLIYISSRDDRIEFMNRKLIERTGRDAVGEYCYKVLHDMDSVCPWCVNDRVFMGETVHREMFSPKDKSWYHVVNVPIRHSDGSMSKHCMMFDISDRKLFEEELQRQKMLLEELNDTLEKRVGEEVAKNREKDIMLIQQNRQAALGEMLDHITHQWKQPLNSISLIIQDLEETASDGELTDEHVEATVGKTMALLDHMAQTIDIFRGFYRPDKEKKVFNIKDSIDQALAFVAPAFRYHSIAVELDVDPGLTAFGYPKEYAQVLLNILANARDVFRARVTEKPRLILRAFAEDNTTVVTITDNAGGIPETIKDKIFDFYFTTNESNGGTGIGLYMSKNIIEKNMGGTLSVVNTDSGAQFRIEVKLS